MDRSQIAIIIPAYNEEKTIGKVVQGALKFGDVFVVDDCSKDNTVEIAQKAGAVVVSHESNKGYDGALNSGFLKAQQLGKKYFITMDADGQHDVASVEKILEELRKDKDLVLGIRPAHARLGEKVFSMYFDARFGVKDVLCGLKGYSERALLINKGFDHINSIGTELSLVSLKSKLSFSQIDIPIHPRVDSPRFGNVIRANYKLIIALTNVIIKDLKISITKSLPG